jgi:hypothetical protein
MLQANVLLAYIVSQSQVKILIESGVAFKNELEVAVVSSFSGSSNHDICSVLLAPLLISRIVILKSKC